MPAGVRERISEPTSLLFRQGLLLCKTRRALTPQTGWTMTSMGL
jgi:hypothetical protein